MTKFSSDVADEDQFFSTHARNGNWSDGQIFNGKTNHGKLKKDKLALKKLFSLKTSINQVTTKVDGSTTSYSSNGIKVSAPIRVGEDVDQRFKNLKLSLAGQPYHDLLLTTNSQYKDYRANEDRTIHKDGPLFWKNMEKLAVSNTSKY